MQVKHNEFIQNFSQTVLEEVLKYLEKQAPAFADEEIKVFDLGCIPWHGFLELSFQTTNEDEDYESDEYDIAGWRLYAFNTDMVEQVESFDHFHQQLQDVYEKIETSKEQEEFTEALLLACAKLTKTKIKDVLIANYNVTKDFEVTVFHPDDPELENYCCKIN